MNCEQGDTAYFKGCGDKDCMSCTPLIGRVVTCVAISGIGSALYEEAAWTVDPPLVHPLLGQLVAAPDSQLRPIRWREGDDETLAWKEVPKVANKQHTS